MAGKAPAHIHFDHWLSNGHMTYIPVAGLAINPAIYVHGVIEEYETGQLIHTLPGDRLLIFPVYRYLLDDRVGWVNNVMAAHALCHTGHTGRRTFAGSVMTEKTIN